MQIESSSRYKCCCEIITVPFQGDQLIVPLRQNMIDFREVYAVNESGFELWNLLCNGHSPAAIAKQWSNSFPLDEKFMLSLIVDFMCSIQSLIHYAND